ncbi:MAG: BrnA antitoxin family protein [Alphaproteobacteria bacterium]|nr:BrnA antitoxin family protein [Alphaproteobacteria bacterium]
MSKKTPAVFDDDNPEWTKADFAKARPASEVLPASFARALVRTRGPQKKPTKVPVSIRLSADVVDHFKAGGPGWQSRIDAALRRAAFSKPSP